MFIYFCGVRGKLYTVLGNSALQLLGKISYSLYLFHLPIGWRLISVVEKLIGAPLGPWLAWLLYLVAVGVSIGAAWVFWRAVEVPSLQLSKRIPLPSGRSLNLPVAVVQELPVDARVEASSQNSASVIAALPVPGAYDAQHALVEPPDVVPLRDPLPG